MRTSRARRRVVPVAVAVIERRGRYLISQRLPGGHLGDYWEFPGGKRRPGEAWTACLRRELWEELGVRIRPLGRLEPIRFRYPDRVVYLAVFSCAMAGRPAALGCRRFRWVRRQDLARYRFPPADLRLIRALSMATQLRQARQRAIIELS